MVTIQNILKTEVNSERTHYRLITPALQTTNFLSFPMLQSTPHPTLHTNPRRQFHELPIQSVYTLPTFGSHLYTCQVELHADEPCYHAFEPVVCAHCGVQDFVCGRRHNTKHKFFADTTAQHRASRLRFCHPICGHYHPMKRIRRSFKPLTSPVYIALKKFR